jgi:hypothetical protein
LHDGENAHYVPAEIDGGTLIAYLVNVNDKNIEKPLARMLIKPFINVINPTDIAFGIENKVYGTGTASFVDVVSRWVNAVNNARALNGIFQFNPKSYRDVHGDNFKTVITLGKPDTDQTQIDQIIADPDNIQFIKDPSYELQMAAVKQKGQVIRFIKDPSYELQLAAVNQTGMALQYIKDPSYELQLAAVKQNGYAIRFIKDPSYELQLAAVKQNAHAIRFIKDPSEEIQLAAVKQNGYAIQFIKDPSEAIQLAAVKQNGYAIQHIKDPSEEIQLAAVRQDGYAIQYIKDPSEAIQLAAVKQNGYAIQHIKDPTRKVIDVANSNKTESLNSSFKKFLFESL